MIKFFGDGSSKFNMAVIGVIHCGYGGKGHCLVRSSISSLLILRTRDTSVKHDTSVSVSELRGVSDWHNKALKKNDNGGNGGNVVDDDRSNDSYFRGGQDAAFVAVRMLLTRAGAMSHTFVAVGMVSTTTGAMTLHK